MTIKQLKEAIKDLPDHMEVMIYNADARFEYCPAKVLGEEHIEMYQNHLDDEPTLDKKYFVLRDEF